MANLTIKELPQITATNSTDSVAIWDDSGSLTAQITIADLETDILATAGIAPHMADATIHRVINDVSTAATALWSASKINNVTTGNASNLSSHTGDATIHRAINDGSTATTALWSASKISSEIASSGAGDFLANGSVAMTGTFNLASQVVDSTSADTKHLFGRAAIGSATGAAGFASFSHRDRASITESALYQNSNGNVSLNAKLGNLLDIRKSNVVAIRINDSEMQLYSHNINLREKLIVSDDADTLHTFGRAAIGYDGTHADDAILAHRDHTGVTAYGFRQNSVGRTTINSATGQSTAISVANVEKIGVSSSQVTLSAALYTGSYGISTADADVICTLGQATIGYNGTNAGDAIFSHRDFATGANYAVLQNSAGDTYVNAATARVLRLGVGASAIAGVSTGFFYPTSDDVTQLGSAATRWTDVWATNGTIQTSDKRQKTAIKKSGLGLAFLNSLEPVSYKWKDGGKRDHYGLIAQDVVKALGDAGVKSDDFAGYIYSKGDVVPDGAEKPKKASDSHGLRMTEFIAPMIKAIQELSAQVEELKGQL